MKFVREALRLLKKNARPLLCFELILKLATAALFVPLFKMSFTGVMRLAGYRYLTAENALAFLRHPVTLLSFLLLLTAAAVYAAFDLGAVLYLLAQSAQDRRCRLLPAMRHGLRCASRIFRSGNLLLLIALPLLAPLAYLSAWIGLVGGIRVPDLLINTLLRNRMIVLGLCVMLALLLILQLSWLYAGHFYGLNGLSFREARKVSVRLTKRRRIADLLHLLLMQGLLFLLFLITALLGLLLTALLFRLVPALPDRLLSAAASILLIVLLICLAALSVPCHLAAVTVLLKRRAAAGDCAPTAVAAPPPVPSPRRALAERIAGAVLLTAALIGCTLVVYNLRHGRYNLDIEYVRTTEITAHRGASADYPENTMAAFRGAWEQGADWIELDVRQSSDGVLYVMHDASFARTAGVHRNAWELTWAEIAALDAGSFFSAEYCGEAIPTLAEVLDFARWHGIRLNIELKPSGHETNLEQCVVDLIRAYGFEEACVVTSQRYSALERVKAYAPEIETVYVASVALGDIGQLRAADHFSIEATFITRSLVASLHDAGHQVYAWTVDSRDTINRMIGYGVDNVITNNVPLARECVGNAVSELVQSLLEEISELDL